jgi:hypothetical protein
MFLRSVLGIFSLLYKDDRRPNLSSPLFYQLFILFICFQEIVQDPIWHRIVFTQDWHPADHISFYSNWRLRALDPAWDAAHLSHNVSLFEEVVFAREPTPYAQILWPDHCVQGSEGEEHLL